MYSTGSKSSNPIWFWTDPTAIAHGVPLWNGYRVEAMYMCECLYVSIHNSSVWLCSVFSKFNVPQRSEPLGNCIICTILYTYIIQLYSHTYISLGCVIMRCSTPSLGPAIMIKVNLGMTKSACPHWWTVGKSDLYRCPLYLWKLLMTSRVSVWVHDPHWTS